MIERHRRAQGEDRKQGRKKRRKRERGQEEMERRKDREKGWKGGRKKIITNIYTGRFLISESAHHTVWSSHSPSTGLVRLLLLLGLSSGSCFYDAGFISELEHDSVFLIPFWCCTTKHEHKCCSHITENSWPNSMPCQLMSFFLSFSIFHIVYNFCVSMDMVFGICWFLSFLLFATLSS